MDHFDDLSVLSDAEYEDLIERILWPTTFELCSVVLFAVMFIIGVIGNLLVVFVVARNSTMWSSMNLFLVNLAISDLLVLIICLPPTVITDITKTYWFSASICKLTLFSQNTSVYVSILTLVAISVERYQAVCSPLRVPVWRTCWILIAIWAMAALLSLPEPLTVSTHPHVYNRANFSTRWGTRCAETWSASTQRWYQLIQTIGLFIMPLVLISVLCMNMARVLRRSEALELSGRQLKNRKRAANMLIIVVCLFAICYLPVHLHNIATAFEFNPMDNPFAHTVRKFITRLTSYSACCVNPILYNFMSEKFRGEFRRAVSGHSGGRSSPRRHSLLTHLNSQRPSSGGQLNRHTSFC